MDRDAATVVIPAHNEAAVLTRCLTTLLHGAEPGEIDVIVVANACTDATADVARRFGVRVIETPAAGKAGALRLGDQAARTFPRIYLDADVDLSIESVRALVDTLARPGVLATSPVPRVDLSGATRSARRVLRVHELMMSGRRGLSGAGVYCLNEFGHSRVAPFPDVVSDDGYVHRSFAPGERVVTVTASTLVRPAATCPAILRRRTRVRQGNRQLDAMGLPLAEGRLGLRHLADLLRARRVDPADAVCYLSLTAIDRWLVAWRTLRGTTVSWGTDRSSRQAT